MQDQPAAGDGQVEFRAGATDLEDRRRRGLVARPPMDLRPTPARTTIERLPGGGVRIGALVRLAAIAADARIVPYRAVALAAGGLATPQIRAVATLGGALLQRSRCWYFRQDCFTCFKRGGDGCPARNGDHRFGVVLDRGPCIWPHPSTIGVALLAYDASIETDRERRLTIAELVGDGSDPTRDHHLADGEVLESVLLPPPVEGERSAYMRATARVYAEWPLVEVVVRLRLAGATIADAVLSAGAVANVPLRLADAESRLQGCDVSRVVDALADYVPAGRLLETMTFKIALLRGCIAEVVELAREPAPPALVGGALPWNLPS